MWLFCAGTSRRTAQWPLRTFCQGTGEFRSAVIVSSLSTGCRFHVGWHTDRETGRRRSGRCERWWKGTTFRSDSASPNGEAFSSILRTRLSNHTNGIRQAAALPKSRIANRICPIPIQRNCAAAISRRDSMNLPPVQYLIAIRIAVRRVRPSVRSFTSTPSSSPSPSPSALVGSVS